jgi:hypothetical protein
MVSKPRNEEDVCSNGDACLVLRHFKTLNMEAVFPSETSVNFYRTTRRQILEGSIAHSHHYANHKSNSVQMADLWNGLFPSVDWYTRLINHFVVTIVKSNVLHYCFGWSGNASDLYSEDDWFDTRLEHRLSSLRLIEIIFSIRRISR